MCTFCREAGGDGNDIIFGDRGEVAEDAYTASARLTDGNERPVFTENAFSVDEKSQSNS